MTNEKICPECDNRRVIIEDDEAITCPACIDDWSDFEKLNGVGDEELNR